MRHWGKLAACLALLLLAGCGGGAGSALSGRACLAKLSDDRVDYRPLDGVDAGASCVVDTPVRVTRVAAGLNKPATMSCALAARLDEFERKVVQPVAREELGQRVIRINHLGSFSCRGMNGGRGRLSQHALGRALDIAGFRLADGSAVSVEHDWAAPGPKRLFLRHLARRACEYFSVVLTPESDAAHHNHLHLDIGPDRRCSV
jgi:hypothetical protein